MTLLECWRIVESHLILLIGEAVMISCHERKVARAVRCSEVKYNSSMAPSPSFSRADEGPHTCLLCRRTQGKSHIYIYCSHIHTLNQVS